MSGVKPVPTPARLRWREFRVQVVPWLVYAGTLVVSAFIWANHVTPSQLVGQVVTDQAEVRSSRAGHLLGVSATPFQQVRAGEPLVELAIAEPRLAEARLAVVRAEVAVLRSQGDAALGLERARVDFERLRLDWLEQRVELASARVRLAYAKADADRLEKLRVEPAGVVSADEAEEAASNRDALEVEIKERESMVAQIEDSMKRFQFADIKKSAGVDQEDPMKAALDLQESRLRLAEVELRPVTLTAPIDGEVSEIFRQAGENVAAGDIILTIRSTKGERIRAYVLPPIGPETKVGTRVEVLSRTTPRKAAYATVASIGGFMTVVPPLLMASSGNGETLGVPIDLTVPGELQLRPGELVDLRWVPGGAGPN
ncbi:MAG: HlyD family efflux transporter periplasmic adaptor subunit [Verrucomicrobiae bacterium]|nr:HlyD family efflux transporter periplasmic adaptor subunit [Verrucomicrobiae bacterium]